VETAVVFAAFVSVFVLGILITAVWIVLVLAIAELSVIAFASPTPKS
jgi:hypothetical protein